MHDPIFRYPLGVARPRSENLGRGSLLWRTLVMKPVRLTILSIFTLGCCATAALAEDYAAVKEQISKKWNALKSMRCEMHTVNDIDMEGYKSHSEQRGTQEMVRISDKMFKMRMEGKGSDETNMGGQVTKTTTEIIMVVDGTHVYNYTNSNGEKNAMKMKIPEGQDMADPLAGVEDSWNIEVLADEKVDGADCWVLQMTPKQAPSMPQEAAKMVQHVRKDCGVAIKIVTYLADGKPMSTTTLSKVEINPQIPDERFVFKAPEGVEVMDMSAMMEQFQKQMEEQAAGDDEP
ncbi:MAG: outer membrane lipoprotein carrier protein LolA [Planctomycetota bacterium]|nr:MAG: outer membrane lipoprotein carrier protein LolA [Planctomycetota bacterium]